MTALAAAAKAPGLVRATFTTSRLLDFASEKELVAQTGHDSDEWPLVILKELVDNALDACEEAGAAPEITIRVDGASMLIADNGPGLPASTIESILDFSTRTSSREAYVSPTRGAQGNALKTIVAMPFVLSGGERGVVGIASHGLRHRIEFAVDHIRQAPAISHVATPSSRKNGTEVIVHSRPIRPDMLGVIGRDHFETRFRVAGCEMETFDYRKIADHDADGIPCLVETAFGWLGDNAPNDRRMITGVNWSPAIRDPFRQLGAGFYAASLDSLLERQRVGHHEPVIFVLHAACSRVEYLDRGKSAVVTS